MDPAITAAHAAVFSDEDPATWRVIAAPREAQSHAKKALR
jgi:hypothetical protein